MHVLLVEDNALVASGVRAGLQLQGFGVDTVASAGQADAAIRSSHFDACVLDLGLPDEDGLSLLARWRGQGLQVPVLVLTARDAVSQRIEGLQTGADDYLVKPFDLHELAARLHALLRRAAGRSVDWIELGEVRINPAAGHIQRQGRTVELSRREWSLLRAAAVAGPHSEHRATARQPLRLQPGCGEQCRQRACAPPAPQAGP